MYARSVPFCMGVPPLKYCPCNGVVTPAIAVVMVNSVRKIIPSIFFMPPPA